MLVVSTEGPEEAAVNRRLRCVAVWTCLAALVGLAVPVAHAQTLTAGITGTVRDESQAVLPGVTVEAASPALIEKVRSTITDGEGRYNFVDLVP
ncbi:MAG: carboxypeptidase-like regulatory domain-containing protein, partial [Vicinamibacterales bacterium]